jgi:hypothetical protein
MNLNEEKISIQSVACFANKTEDMISDRVRAMRCSAVELIAGIPAG